MSGRAGSWAPAGAPPPTLATVRPLADFDHDRPQRNYSAKYLYYLNEYHMRLRKQVGLPPNDAAGEFRVSACPRPPPERGAQQTRPPPPRPAPPAGLLGGSRYHGRNTPLKGKGQPPADEKQAEDSRESRHKVPGRSYLPR